MRLTTASVFVFFKGSVASAVIVIFPLYVRRPPRIAPLRALRTFGPGKRFVGKIDVPHEAREQMVLRPALAGKPIDARAALVLRREGVHELALGVDRERLVRGGAAAERGQEHSVDELALRVGEGEEV